MARKPAARVAFTLFEAVYEYGSQRSNRRVPTGVLGGPDGDAAARVVIEEQQAVCAENVVRLDLAIESPIAGRAVIAFLVFVLALFTSPFKSKLRLEAENAALRHRLAVLRRKVRG